VRKEPEVPESDMGRPLFSDQRERNIGIAAVAAVALHGLIAARHPGSKEELNYDAFALARSFIERAESMFEHEDSDTAQSFEHEGSDSGQSIEGAQSNGR
jgi:hypothetical protein